MEWQWCKASVNDVVDPEGVHGRPRVAVPPRVRRAADQGPPLPTLHSIPSPVSTSTFNINHLQNQSKPYDSKKSVWVPDKTEGYLAGEIKSTKGDNVVVVTEKGTEVRTLPQPLAPPAGTGGPASRSRSRKTSSKR